MPDSPSTPEQIPSFTQEFAATPAGQAAQAAAPQTQTAPASPPPSWSDYAQEVGFNTEGYSDEKAFFQSLAENYRQVAEQARYAQEFQAVAPEFQEFLSTRGKKAEPAPKQDEPKEWTVDGHFQKVWERPQRDPSWEQMIQMGWIAYEDGQYVPKSPYAPASAVTGLNAERSWQRDSLNKLLENPHKLIYDGIQEPLERRMRELVQEMLGGYQSQQNLDSFEQQHAEILFQKTQDGSNYAVDSTGRLVPSFFGTRFYQHVAHFRQFAKTPEEAANMAFAMAESDTIRAAYQQEQLARAQQTPPNGQPPNGQAPANGAPSNGQRPRGPDGKFLPQDSPESQTRETFLKTAIDRAMHNPSGNAAHLDTEPQTVTHRAQLAGLFSNPARELGLT